MRTNMNVKVLALLLFCFIAGEACVKQKNLWKGTLEEKGGIVFVRNPKEPMYSEDAFRLEEELSITQLKGVDELLFSEIRSLAVDEQGRIYALDFKESNLKVFDPDGNHLKTFGKRGQGPGELSLPVEMLITSQKEIVVEDFRNKLAYFSPEGKFLKSIPSTKAGVTGIDIDSLGNIVGLNIVRENENSRYEVKKFDPDLNFLHSLCSTPLTGTTASRYNPFTGALRYAVYEDDKIICGYPEKYEIKIYHPTGELEKVIIKDYERLEITEAEINDATKGLPPELPLSIPKYHPPFSQLLADDEGRIFVRTPEKIESDAGYYYDVFDKEGKYLVKIPLKFQPRVFKNDHIYTINEDEEGNQAIKKYKVIWNLRK